MSPCETLTDNPELSVARDGFEERRLGGYFAAVGARSLRPHVPQEDRTRVAGRHLLQKKVAKGQM